MDRSFLEPYVEALLFLWRQIAQHQGDELIIEQWLTAYQVAWQPECLLSALPLAASRWLDLFPAPGDRLIATRVMATLGTLMQQQPQGDDSAQTELAIAVYRRVLAELSPINHLEDWAKTMNNLAMAYRHRAIGKRATNLEQAIALYQQVLPLSEANGLTHLRCVTLTGLAASYRELQVEQPADHLEQAIDYYRQALAILPCSALPVAHAFVKNQLAAAYSDRRVGDRLDNVETALRLYGQTKIVSS